MCPKSYKAVQKLHLSLRFSDLTEALRRSSKANALHAKLFPRPLPLPALVTAALPAGNADCF